MSQLNGYQGEIRAADQPNGYFTAGTNLGNLIKQQSFIEDPIITRIGIDGNPQMSFTIDGAHIVIGKTGMYEACGLSINLSDSASNVNNRNTFIIESDSTPETIIDYIII